MVGCVILNFNDSKTTIELLNRMKNMKSIDVIVVVDNCLSIPRIQSHTVQH